MFPKKRIPELLTDFIDVDQLSGAAEVGASRALLKAITGQRAAIDRELSTNPKIVTDGDIRDDFRYLLGAREALDMILLLPGEAKKLRDEKRGAH